MTSADHVSEALFAYSWEWDTDEYARLVRIVQRHAKFAWIVSGFFVVVVITAVLGAALAAYYVAIGAFARALSVGPWLLIMLFWVVFFRWWVPQASAKAFRKMNDGRIHFSMSSEDLENGSETVSTKLRWSTIDRAVETQEVILFFYTGNCALYLPKRAVPEEALPAIREAIRDKLGDRAKLTK